MIRIVNAKDIGCGKENAARNQEDDNRGEKQSQGEAKENRADNDAEGDPQSDGYDGAEEGKVFAGDEYGRCQSEEQGAGHDGGIHNHAWSLDLRDQQQGEGNQRISHYVKRKSGILEGDIGGVLRPGVADPSDAHKEAQNNEPGELPAEHQFCDGLCERGMQQDGFEAGKGEQGERQVPIGLANKAGAIAGRRFSGADEPSLSVFVLHKVL